MKKCLHGDILVIWNVSGEEHFSGGTFSVEECFSRGILSVEECRSWRILSAEECFSRATLSVEECRSWRILSAEECFSCVTFSVEECLSCVTLSIGECLGWVDVSLRLVRGRDILSICGGLPRERTRRLYEGTGAVPWRHTLGSWLWRAGHAGVGDRHAPRRRDTRLIVDEGLLN